jgi:DNA mismatch repair protein MutS2
MIDTHSLEVLEFPRVKELAAAGAGSERGAEWVRSLAPVVDPGVAGARLDLTDELRRLILSAEGFPRVDTPEVRDTLERLEAAGLVLEPAELRDLARVAALTRLVRDRLIPRREAAAPAADFPLAVQIAAGLIPCPELERAVAETFGPHDDILDSASGTLRQVRRHVRQQRERILQRLEAAARGDDERRVTLRGDRYVVAVRAGDRNAMGGGIVHDRSGTGATLYLEPLGVVEENNRLVELLVEEREEIRRILAALSDLARQRRRELGIAAEALARLDGHRALAALAESQGAVRPRLSEGARLVLNARHPCSGRRAREVEPLELAPDPPAEGDADPVPPAGDAAAAYRARAAAYRQEPEPAAHLTPRARVLLLTGPNMGGKTVALKGVGLACVMAACGFHLPAGPGTEVPLLEGLVADIGDEQSMNDLHLASHLRRWIKVSGAPGRGRRPPDETGRAPTRFEGAGPGGSGAPGRCRGPGVRDDAPGGAQAFRQPLRRHHERLDALRSGQREAALPARGRAARAEPRAGDGPPPRPAGVPDRPGRGARGHRREGDPSRPQRAPERRPSVARRRTRWRRR